MVGWRKGGEVSSVTLGCSCVVFRDVDGAGTVCSYYCVWDGWTFEIGV